MIFSYFDMKAKKIYIWKFIFICIWFESISKNGYCYYYYIFWLKFANQWKTNHIYFSILSVFVRVITQVQRALILWPVWKSFWKIHIYESIARPIVSVAFTHLRSYEWCWWIALLGTFCENCGLLIFTYFYLKYTRRNESKTKYKIQTNRFMTSTCLSSSQGYVLGMDFVWL